jgi:hypothetical protein
MGPYLDSENIEVELMSHAKRATAVLFLLSLSGCGAFGPTRFVSYEEQLQPMIGRPISEVAARLGAPYRKVNVGSEDQYVYLDGQFTPSRAVTTGTSNDYGIGTQYSGTTTMQGGDFVGCVVTFRVNNSTNLIAGFLTEPHTNGFVGGCPGKYVPVQNPTATQNSCNYTSAPYQSCRNRCTDPSYGREAQVACAARCDSLC